MRSSIIAAIVIVASSANAADYVMTDTRLPIDKQVIFRRTDGAMIYPFTGDPNLMAYQAFLSQGGVPDRPISSPPDGIMVVSTGTPALNGPYAFTEQAKAIVLQISIYALANNKFPAGFAQMPWRDSLGNVHTFTLAQWKNFVSALIDYEVALRAGQSPTLPVVIP